MIKYFCDADGKEFNPQEGLCTMMAMLPKVNEKMEKTVLRHEGNYCAGCTELIFNFVATLKNELSAEK